MHQPGNDKTQNKKASKVFYLLLILFLHFDAAQIVNLNV